MNKIKSKLITGGLLVSVLTYTSPVFAYTKEETVYSKMNSQGENYQTTVSTHIENTDNQKLLEDLTNLLNIQNTNGDETYEKNGNKLIWQADGEDIYYQGDTKKQLPITCEIKYTLDGKEISAEELAGKNGKVTIEITYINHEKHEMIVNGTNTTLYTPFLVLSGTILNNDTNKNISISNGKVINDGSKTIVVGMAVPGMKESLNISNDKISDSIKITMEATDFELSNIITLATPKILNEEDMSILDDLDEIYNQISTLQSSSNKIEEGANTLKEGTTTYYEKVQEFNQAMTQVEQGATSASSQYSKLNNGIASLNSSSTTLNAGAKSISDGTQAVQENLQKISGGLQDVKEGSTALNTGIQQVQTGVSQIQTSVEAMSKVDNTETIAKITQLKNANNTAIGQLESKLATTMGVSIAQIKQLETLSQEKLQTQIASMSLNTEQISELQSTLSLIGVLQANNMALDQTLTTLKSSQTNLETLNSSLKQVENGLDELTIGAENLTDGISTLKTGTDTLASKSSELVAGSKQLYTGTQALQTGTKELAAGSSQMQTGLYTLQNGTSQLLNANNQLTDGARTLDTGATTLAEGIHTFNREGIQPICNYMNGNLRNLTNRAEKLIELSQDYQTFTELKDGEEGNVKFIMMTDAIHKKDTEEQAVITEVPSADNKEESEDNN